MFQVLVDAFHVVMPTTRIRNWTLRRYHDLSITHVVAHMKNCNPIMHRAKHLNMWITMLSVEKGSTCVLAVHLRLPYRAVKYHPLPPPLGLRQNECLRKNGVFRSQKMPLGLCRNEECWKWIPLRVYLLHYEQMYNINVPQVSPEGEKSSKGLSYTEPLP